jgi:mannose-6-phosphate isomerase-like protein (cupin superfamily)
MHKGTCIVRRVLEREKKETQAFCFLDFDVVQPGMAIDPHNHPQEEIYIIVKGEGTMQVGKDEKKVGTKDVISIPPNEMHSLANTGKTPINLIVVSAEV